MEGTMYTKQINFYTDQMDVVNIALINMWNTELKTSLNVEDASKFTRKDMQYILDYVTKHKELFYNERVYDNFVFNMQRLIMVMHGKEKCSITYY